MRKRLAMMAGMAAVVGLSAFAGADEPSPTIKQAMAKLHKGATAALPSVKKAVNAESPDWKGIKTTAKLISELSEAITSQKPPKGNQSNYETLAKAYASTAADLKTAADKEDIAGAKKAVNKLQASCMPCHTAHKGK